MAAPHFNAAPQIAQNVAVGQSITCAIELAYDGSTITCSFEWVDGDGDVLQTDSPVAVSAAGTSYYYGIDYYGIVSDNIGQTITCNVTATNDDGSTTQASNTVGPVPDLILVTSPVITGDPIIGQTLTCDNGAWTNDDSTITYQYTWDSDSSSDTLGSDNTYVINAGDYGGYIQCQVFATDDTGTVEGDSDAVGPVVTDGDVVNPSITAVSPGSLEQGASGVAVAITGTGFLGGIELVFSNDLITLGGLTFNSAESLTAYVYVDPSAPLAFYAITVTNGDGGTFTLSASYFEVTGAPAVSTPTITSISPTSMPEGTTGDVVFTGTGFYNDDGNDFFADVDDSETLGITTNSWTFDSSTQATVNITTGDTLGTTDVAVDNPDTGHYDLPDSFTVTAAPVAPSNSVAPFITGSLIEGHILTCNPGTWTGSPTPTIAYVWIGTDGGSAVQHYTPDEADIGHTIYCQVTATNDGGSEALDTPSVLIAAPSGGGVSGPSVSTVTAASLAQATSGTLTIAGAGFVDGAVVTMSGAGITVNSYAFVSSTEMTVNVTIDSAATVGVSDVTVTNPDSGVGTGVGAFGVTALSVFSLSPWRWVLSDTTVPESYTFAINPDTATGLPLQKNLNIYQLTSDDAEMVLYEGSDTPQLVVVSGTLLTEDQLTQMIYWYSKRRPVQLTDDLGRTSWVYFSVFTPTRAWVPMYPWRHTWSASFYVVGPQGVTTL